jgi:hypothetical protein
LALAGKKDVGEEEEEEEEEEERGERRGERKRRKGERGRRKEKDSFEKRKAHSSWVSLSFLAADLVVVFLLLLCSCWILVGFLLDFFTVVVYEQGLGFIISLEYPRAWTTCRWTRKKTTTRSTPT